MLIGQKPLVIYFTPKTIHRDVPQACSFRDQYEDFKDLGAEVIGISSDTVESHQNLLNSTNYLFLLSDHDKKIRRLWFHQECLGCFRKSYLCSR
jgi:peroxiredoxin Q/BCP